MHPSKSIASYNASLFEFGELSTSWGEVGLYQKNIFKEGHSEDNVVCLKFEFLDDFYNVLYANITSVFVMSL